MTDSITESVAGNVTPLPVKTKRTDSTAALRQRRRRAKRKTGLLANCCRVRQPCRYRNPLTKSKPMSRLRLSRRHRLLSRW
jgi:hypothetical protein